MEGRWRCGTGVARLKCRYHWIRHHRIWQHCPKWEGRPRTGWWVITDRYDGQWTVPGVDTWWWIHRSADSNSNSKKVKSIFSFFYTNYSISRFSFLWGKKIFRKFFRLNLEPFWRLADNEWFRCPNCALGAKMSKLVTLANWIQLSKCGKCEITP